MFPPRGFNNQKDQKKIGGLGKISILPIAEVMKKQEMLRAMPTK